MRIKKLILVLALILPFVIVTSTVMGKRPVIIDETAIWELTDIQVIDEGELVALQEGNFTKDVVIEARATASNGRILPSGVFQMTFSAFTPFAEMNQQKPGFWYVQGYWSVTKDNPDREAMRSRHNSEMLEGDILAEVPFDPTADSINWTALARLTMTLMAGNWANGEGTLTMNQDNTGSLFLDLTTWPDMRAEVNR
jgi:hypothetical protein